MSIKYIIPKEPPRPENSLVLGFQEETNGDISITATDKNGEVWYLLSLNTDGTFERFGGLPEVDNIQVDSEGRLLEKKGDR